MTDRLDAVTAREYLDRNGNKKTQWTKIGSAWPTKNDGWSISLEALPLPVMGERGLETRILLMVPKAKDEPERQQRSQQPRQQSYGEASGGTARDLDDDLPF